MKTGTNTFGLGMEFSGNFKNALKRLKEAKITSIEPLIDFDEETGMPSNIKKMMRQYGMLGGAFLFQKAKEKIDFIRSQGFEVYCIHLYCLKFEKKSMEKAISFMKENNIGYAVYSLKEKSIGKIKEKKELIEEIISMFENNGKTLLFHNHADEFTDDNGNNVMNYMFENIKGFRAELDVGWETFAGSDPCTTMLKYPSQISILHIKEIKAYGMKTDTAAPFCVAPGEGILHLKEIMETSKKIPLDKDICYIIDQDNSMDNDIIADIAKGVAAMEKYLGE